MQANRPILKWVIPALIVLISVSTTRAQPPSLNIQKIETVTGLKGQINEKEGVFKVNFPRSDLKVTIAGVKATPPMGLASWAAFKKVGDNAMVRGDTVLWEDQVNPVMSVALEENTFTISQISVGNSTGFSVYVPDVPIVQSNNAYITYERGTVSFLVE